MRSLVKGKKLFSIFSISLEVSLFMCLLVKRELVLVPKWI